MCQILSLDCRILLSRLQLHGRAVSCALWYCPSGASRGLTRSSHGHRSSSDSLRVVLWSQAICSGHRHPRHGEGLLVCGLAHSLCSFPPSPLCPRLEAGLVFCSNSESRLPPLASTDHGSSGRWRQPRDSPVLSLLMWLWSTWLYVSQPDSVSSSIKREQW